MENLSCSLQGKADPRKSSFHSPHMEGMGLGWLLDSQGMHGSQPEENPNPLSCLFVFRMVKLAFFSSLFWAGEFHNGLFQSHRCMAREAEVCLKINLNFLNVSQVGIHLFCAV